MGLVLAYHDRSDGGLFVTLMEMALASRTGLSVNLGALGMDPLAALFSEELGAVLQVRQEVGNEFMGYFCTGTVIAPDVVLTARHCAEQYNVTRVFLKGSDVSKPQQGETINVKETHAHCDPRVDLMLLVLETPSTVETPRAIARAAHAKAKEAVVVGFGRINPAGTKGYGKKRKALVPLITPDCREIDDQAQYGCWTEIELVAGHRGLKRDTCEGDSGGPLYVEDEDGNLVLLGVTSRGVRGLGKPCGNGGIYVRADRFRNWIRAQTGAKV